MKQHLRPIATPLRNLAARAFRRAGFAHIAPVQNQPVMGILFKLRRYRLIERMLGIQRVTGGAQAKPIRHPKHMRIDANCGQAKHTIQPDIRCFAPHAG